jgi:hypothetical protein
MLVEGLLFYHMTRERNVFWVHHRTWRIIRNDIIPAQEMGTSCSSTLVFPEQVIEGLFQALF